jgi:hypothetical protein
MPLKVSWTWEEWRQSRAARRERTRAIGGDSCRRAESSSDKRLRAAFDGARAPDFPRRPASQRVERVDEGV